MKSSSLENLPSLQKVKSELTRRQFKRYWLARYPKYHFASHIQYLVNILQNLQPKQALIINFPPRHSKTETVLAFIEWYLGNHPNKTVMYASYGADLAYEKSRKIRNEIQNGLTFKNYFQVQLAKDATKVGEWRTTQEGGLIAAGVGGALTGKGASLAVIDDPLKGRKDAESKAIRTTVIDWFKSDFLTRLEPDGNIILIQTRWHKEDLTGFILQHLQAEKFGGLEWKKIILPALCESEEDLLEREINAPLWPERWPQHRLEEIRSGIGDYEWAGLYQQRPFVKGGKLFKDNPVRYENVLLNGAVITIGLDTASSKKTSADWTAFVILAKMRTGVVQVIDVVHEKLDIIELAEKCKMIQKKYNQTITIESSSQALPILQYLEQQRIRITPVAPIGDKFTRAQPVVAAWNRGDIAVPVQSPWLLKFLEEVTDFTGTSLDSHDDQVDALAYAYNQINNGVEYGYMDKHDIDDDFNKGAW